MGLRSEGWVSSAVLRDKEVRAAVDDIRRLVRKYGDAGSPALSRKPRKLTYSFLTSEVAIFRPNAILFSCVVLLFAVSGLAYSFTTKDPIDAVAWADVALKAVVPIFVLGISVVNLTRSLSETGRFTGEYLNEACRMPRFCCLTFLAGMMAFVGWLTGKVSSFPPLVSGCIAAGSVGAVIACFAMLAFVIRESIRCLVPDEAIRTVSRFAAANLCHGYLREVYGRVLTTRHNAYLEQWCKEHCRAIHPPSQYYGQYPRGADGSDKENNRCAIQMRKKRPDANAYKDFHLGRLADLETYLSQHGAELHLSSPLYENEQKVLGSLRFRDATQSRVSQKDVERMANRTLRWRSFGYAMGAKALHQSHLNTLETALCKAIGNGETEEVASYLQVAIKPLSIVRQVKGWRVIREADQPSFIGHDLVWLYVMAIQRLLNTIRDGAEYPPGRATELARAVWKSMWEVTRDIYRDMDHHAMELFTRVVPQIYRIIQEAGEKAGPLQDMRAKFGGFYTFADRWLEKTKSEDAKAVERMRLVLHDGLTKWLLMTIEQKDGELTKQLCDAARMIVFGRKNDITFDRGVLMVRHFVLAGHLIGRAKADGIEPAAIERLFWETDIHEPRARFDDLVTFYRVSPFSPDVVESYLDIFFESEQKTNDLLIGGGHSAGSGTTGQHDEMALAFVYVAASLLAESTDNPIVIAEDMSFELNDDAIKTVSDLFKGMGLDHGFELLKIWRDKCRESSNEANAKAIADAKLNPSKVEKWRKKFWETYSRSSPVLSMCIRNGNYEIDKDVCSRLQDWLPKISVIDRKYPLVGGGGDDHGKRFAHFMERQLLTKMLGESCSVSAVEGTLSDLMKKAAVWLKKAACEGEQGVIVLMTKDGPYNSDLCGDADYLPPHREDVQSRGFRGFYQGFPVVWYKKDKEADKVKERSKEPPRERVVAVDLRGWQGVKVRECILTERKFGELEIRPWEEEIQKTLDANKLEPKDVNKAKGYCRVDICLYWELSSSRPPRRRAFQIRVPDGEVPPEDNSEPAKQ